MVQELWLGLIPTDTFPVIISAVVLLAVRITIIHPMVVTLAGDTWADPCCPFPVASRTISPHLGQYRCSLARGFHPRRPKQLRGRTIQQPHGQQRGIYNPWPSRKEEALSYEQGQLRVGLWFGVPFIHIPRPAGYFQETEAGQDVAFVTEVCP